jgi:hypothetical protein
MTLRSRATQESTKQVSPYRAVARTGLYTGLLLTLVMFVALVAANRVPALERFAIIRNAISGGMFFVVALIPIVRFLGKPLQLFSAAMIAWLAFAGAFNLAGLIFRNLYLATRIPPFQAFVLGASVYGLCAVISWVVGIILRVKRRPTVPENSGAREVVKHTP